ncbi:MAG: hypothetical protein GY754_15860 [bacterium]|nr:hypothetical protein [bacterium]
MPVFIIHAHQTRVRNNFSQLVHIWKLFDNGGSIMHESWNLDTRYKSLTGYNEFIQENFHHFNNGEPLELFKPINEQRTVQNFQVTTGTSTGRIQCSFDPVPDGMHLTLFVEQADNGELSDEIARHDHGANPTSPITIQGLALGVNHIVYAVITDLVYENAQSVSAAVTGSALASGTRPTN